VSALLNEDERMAMEFYIACAPEDHPVIPGAGGFRKARWAGRGKGKSGGFRALYRPVSCLLVPYSFRSSGQSTEIAVDNLFHI
jgi:hypothetical protein